MHHGNKLKELVKSNRYSTSEIAELLEVHPKYMYYLYNKETINYGLLNKVAKVFGKQVYFFFENGDTTEQVNENIAEYGQIYIKKYIISLESQIKLLTEDNIRLTKEVESLKKKLGD